jgi:hypothetical protein
MAAGKPPYDPVKTVEAMFMGSVARIAYVMKDPVNYAPATKAVLAETAKKFQDALDDCEIRILEAKWYLERQLEVNKARREAKAREESAASAKRKRDEAQDLQDKAHNADGESAPKRVKTQEPEDPVQGPIKTQQKPQQTSPIVETGSLSTAAASKPAPQPAPDPPQKAATAHAVEASPETTRAEANASQAPAATASKVQEKPKPPEPVLPPERTMTQTTADDFPKPTPQDTPAENHDAFTFESMFGEPSADLMDATGSDMPFDLDDLGGETYTGDGGNMNLPDNSLNSLLPGLESYANQAGDDTGFNMPAPSTNLNGVTAGLDGITDLGVTSSENPPNPQSQQPQQITNINDFSLPSLGGPNEFDEFLNANDLNFDEANNFEDNGLLNLEDNMDFDSMFS